MLLTVPPSRNADSIRRVMLFKAPAGFWVSVGACRLLCSSHYMGLAERRA